MRVTFLHHSGFSVEVGGQLLLFDYWQPGKPTFDPASLGSFSRATIFASHSHGDHFDPVICSWNAPNLRYVFSPDIPAKYDGHRDAPGQTLDFGDMRVSAISSTDQGVAFLVNVGGKAIFHAGDLNLWSWVDESTPAEVSQAREAFISAISPLVGQRVDVCLFPVDARMGTDFDEGALWVLRNVKPRAFMPMHFTGHAASLSDFARRADGLADIRLLTRSGEFAEFE